MDIKELGEFGLIEYIQSEFPAIEGLTGIGDDCAILPQRNGMETLVSTDMLIEGCHFLIGDISPYQLGWKSAAVNISDLAAMGAKPVASFLSIALPSGISSQWMKEFVRGYKEISLKYNCALLGGDTTSSHERVCINVTVLGECPKGMSKRRKNALVGDLVCVSGCLGDAAGGLKIILEGRERSGFAGRLIERHYLPEPRVEEGLALAASTDVHAMMDISDGIGSDLRHILKASSVGARIDCSLIPISKELKLGSEQYEWDAMELALCGGEDYELLFTVAKGAEIPIEHFVIGEITEAAGIQWIGTDKDYLGFRHF